MMKRVQAAEQMRRALQMLAMSLADENAMEVAAVFDPWEIGKSYTAGTYLTYGRNGVGDPQLYKAVQDHTAQADWTPEAAVSLYVAVGLDEQGYPVWSQPAGAQDAYQTGDIVRYKGILYRSLMDGNIYAPDVYPAGWTAISE